MTWADYYEGFYEWATSTQIKQIYSLTDFGSQDEICEVAENLVDEKGASALIRKSLRLGATFDAAHIIQLAECIEAELLKTLLTTLPHALTLEQIAELENVSMLSFDDITALRAKQINFANLSWEQYCDSFYDLSAQNKTLGILQLKNFGNASETLDLAYELDDLTTFNLLIQKALDFGVRFSSEQLSELFEFDDKKLNARLVFEHLYLFKGDAYEELADYLYPIDFKKLAPKSQTPPPPLFYETPPKKPGFFAQLGFALIGINLFNYLFRGKDGEDD